MEVYISAIGIVASFGQIFTESRHTNANITSRIKTSHNYI